MVAAVLLSASVCSAEPLLEKTDLFVEQTDGFVLYRIPGVVVTAKGTVLAYCEARKFTDADRGEIEIHMRRSTDGGRTWAPAKQVAHMGPRLSRNPHMSASKMKKIDKMGGPDEQTVNNPVAIAGRDGTVHFVYCVEYMRCFYMRSDDDGATWHAGEMAIPSAGESIAAELSDGSVMLSAKNGFPGNRHAVATSPDGATGWSETRLVDELLEPGCMASLASHPEAGCLLFSNPDTTKKAHSERKYVTVKLSRDDGRTWPVSKLLENGPSAYSDLAVLPDGTVLCFYESGRPGANRPHRAWAYACLRMARFNLDWIMDVKNEKRNN